MQFALLTVLGLVGLTIYSELLREKQVQDDERLQQAADLLEQVISAHGGRCSFAKAMIGSSTQTVTDLAVAPLGTTAEIVEHFDLPKRLKREVHAEAIGESRDLTFLVNENGSWKRVGDGRWTEIPKPSDEIQTFPSGNFDVLIKLIEVRDGLSVLTDGKLFGKPAVVIRRTVDDAWAGDLFIDPETKLLLGSRHPVWSITEEEFVETTTHYKNYKKVDGVFIPMLTESFQNGKLVVKYVVSEIKFLPSIEDSVFELDDDD